MAGRKLLPSVSLAAAPIVTTVTTPAQTAVATSAIVQAGAVATPLWVSALQVLPPVACQVVFFAPLETMKTIKENGTTGNLPLVPYVSMAINGVLWMVYGGLVGQPTIWAPNISGAIFGSYYWYTYAKYCPPSFPMKTYYAVGTGAIASIFGIATLCEPALAINLLGMGGNVVVVAMFGGPLVAIQTVLREKNTKSLPFGMCIATFINCTLWTSYGLFVTHDPYVWFCNGLGLISSIVQLGLFARFGLPPKK
jgi:uncharacterized protein with PQ loop repeat